MCRHQRSPIHVYHAMEFAVRALLVLAGRSSTVRLPADAIAREMEIPPDFLRKILLALTRAKILSSRRGAGGGIRLARRPETVTLLEVMETTMGPLALTDCTRTPPACPRIGHCPVRRTFQKAEEELRETLAAATLASLTNGKTHGNNGNGPRIAPIADGPTVQERDPERSPDAPPD